MKEQYKLYIGAFQKTDCEYTYYNGDYMLAFSNRYPRGEWKEVPPENEGRLCASAIRWLMGVKGKVNAKALREDGDYMKILDAFYNRFEEELKKESKNENGE